MSQRSLTAQEILSSNDRPPVPVEVPEWGGCVYVRQMCGSERDIYEAELRKGNANLRAKIVAAVVCDEQGNLLFSPSQIEQLGKKNYAALDRIWIAANALNELTEEDIDGLKKTLKAIRSAGSSSD